MKLKWPTPMDAPLHLTAQVVEFSEGRAVLEAMLEPGGQVTATRRGNFVAVREGHHAAFPSC